MACDISGIDCDGFDEDYFRKQGHNPACTESHPEFHGILFSFVLLENHWPRSKEVVYESLSGLIIERMKEVANANNITPMKTDASGRIEVDVQWGSEKGAEITVRGKGEVHDDKGNSVELNIQRNDDGTTNTNIAVEHKSQSDSKK